jgi:hypothetical protein
VLGLETSGARWTAPAFDRCLLLALLYPIVTIIVVWAWSGHVGVAERAIGLWKSPAGDPLSSLKRADFALSVAAMPFLVWLFNKGDRLITSIIWFGLVSGFFVVVTVPGAGVGAFVGLSAIGLASGFAVNGVAFAGAVAFATAFTTAFLATGVFLVFAFAVASTVIFSYWSVRANRQGAFLSLFFPAATGTTFVSVFFLASLESWASAGPLLLVFGVLTLVNAPFDWFAIGLTRALLRRGLAPGGPDPFVIAVVDAIVAAPVIAILAFVTVFAVQTFDDVAVLRAGAHARSLPLGPLFEGLETRPGDPEFWWIWLMLFSTLIPSALNLCIAAASLIRGLPPLNTDLLIS